MENNQLSPYRVTLHEEPGDKFQMVFDCMAEDADHAAEQAENAYPGREVINCTEFEGNLPLNSWLRNLRPGDQVWWNDPDHHKSSGIYRIDAINSDDGVLFDDTILMLKNDAGSNSEVFARELSSVQPDDLFPVVDGDCGNGDLYGYATSKENAIDVGNESFADEVVDAYLAENVTLRDGSKHPKAWVALSRKLGGQVKVRLVLDVTYDLNGVDAEAMRGRLQQMVERAIGDGMLTGSTDTTVDEYSMDARLVPEPLEEDELGDFMRQRINNGEWDLEVDIPVRLVRFGLMDPLAFTAEMCERMNMAKENKL